jgi:hypothetical protein
LRKILGIVLIGVGVFAICLAIGLRFWAVPRAEKTPLDLNIKLVATGDAQVLNASTGDLETTRLQATRRVRSDSAASDSKVVVAQETLCTIKIIDNPPECVDAYDSLHRLLSVTTDRFAADRKTAESVNDPKYHENVDGDTNVKHVGLTYKWPFNSEKKTYQFFDPNLRLAAPAKYIGTDKIEGLELYKYEAVQPAVEHDIAAGIPGTYADTRTVWIHPLTGVIIKGVEHQTLKLANGDTALETTLTFDDASIKYQAKQAKDGAAKIALLGTYLPIGAGLLGLLAVAVGIRLTRGEQNSSLHDGSRPPHRDTDPDDLPLLNGVGSVERQPDFQSGPSI